MFHRYNEHQVECWHKTYKAFFGQIPSRGHSEEWIWTSDSWHKRTKHCDGYPCSCDFHPGYKSLYFVREQYKTLFTLLDNNNIGLIVWTTVFKGPGGCCFEVTSLSARPNHLNQQMVSLIYIRARHIQPNKHSARRYRSVSFMGQGHLLQTCALLV